MFFRWKFNNEFSWHMCISLYVFISFFTGVLPKEILTQEPFTQTHKFLEEVEPLQTRSTGGADVSDYCNCTSLFKCDLRGGPSTKEAVSSENDMDGDENGADLEIINIRNGLGSSSSSSFVCGHYLEICCNHYQSIPRPISTPPPVKQTPTSIPIPTRPGKLQCGKRNDHGVGFRIVGDIEGEAQMGEFPHMVAITEFNKEKQGTVYLCGGSLIHPKVVLTAAHCVQKKMFRFISVCGGFGDKYWEGLNSKMRFSQRWFSAVTPASTQTDREDPYVHQDIPVDKVILHEDYTKKGVLRNDIALILLAKEVLMARHISTICLSSDLNPPGGERCVASGWGKNLFGKDGSYQSILKKIDLPIVPQNACQDKFRNTRLGPNFQLHRSFVCAGGEAGRDTCKGDGGSPLVCKVPNTNFYAQYGIVSWGLNCGEALPGAYVNVPYFVPWIETKFQELDLDSSSFKLSG